MLNPGAGHNGHQPGDLTAAEGVERAPDTAPIPDLPEDDVAEDVAGPERPGTPVSEVVEEYIDE
jgi:hypothetical protein